MDHGGIIIFFTCTQLHVKSSSLSLPLLTLHRHPPFSHLNQTRLAFPGKNHTHPVHPLCLSTPTLMAFPFTIAALAITLLITTVSSQSYTNHTVGGASGWAFNPTTNSTSTDYTKWAASQVFNLGDYLIFNTTTNSTVIQTYNKTTYTSCDTDDASDTDTFYYVGGNEIGEPLVVSVPLTIKGDNYFFSDADDGAQCAHGMAFQVSVKQGLGLPPNLNQPPPPAYIAPPPSDDSPPSTVPNTQQETFYNGGGLNLKDGANVRTGVLVLLAFVIGLLLLA